MEKIEAKSEKVESTRESGAFKFQDLMPDNNLFKEAKLSTADSFAAASLPNLQIENKQDAAKEKKSIPDIALGALGIQSNDNGKSGRFTHEPVTADWNKDGFHGEIKPDSATATVNAFEKGKRGDISVDSKNGDAKANWDRNGGHGEIDTKQGSANVDVSEKGKKGDISIDTKDGDAKVNWDRNGGHGEIDTKQGSAHVDVSEKGKKGDLTVETKYGDAGPKAEVHWDKDGGNGKVGTPVLGVEAHGKKGEGGAEIKTPVGTLEAQGKKGEGDITLKTPLGRIGIEWHHGHLSFRHGKKVSKIS